MTVKTTFVGGIDPWAAHRPPPGIESFCRTVKPGDVFERETRELANSFAKTLRRAKKRFGFDWSVRSNLTRVIVEAAK